MTIPSTVSDVAPTNGKLKSDRAAYLQHLLSLRSDLETPSLDAGTKAWLQQLRDRAAARVQELAIPSTKDEEWRFTDLSALLQVNFQLPTWQPAISLANSSIQRAEIEALVAPEAIYLTFVDDVFVPDLSAWKTLPSGVELGTLRFDDPRGTQVKNYLFKQQGLEDVFSLLNTASLKNPIVISAAKDQAVDTPIEILYISTANKIATLLQPNCLVIAESGSSLTLVEHYISLDEGTYFTNSVTEIWLEANSQVNHTRIQQESIGAFHIGKTAVSQARDSRYTCNAVSLGAKLSRHNLDVYHTGEQTETTLNGLTIISGKQVADTHSTIAYSHPHGSSNQIHKCIVDDRAHAVFNGKVYVPKAAQLTDAKQLSSNLLLSPKARVDTKPQLEITADNVKCTHGATVSQLDSDEVFYLQSRGINEDSARKLLTYAFAYEVIREIPVASLREKLVAIVREQQA